MNSPDEDEWFVRVEGREYGPVAIETLREWRDEGRLIPTNELRRASSAAWHRAGDSAELFPNVAAIPAASHDVIRRRSWGEITRETFRIYRRGFVPMFLFSLLTAIPSFVVQTLVPFSLPSLDGNAALPTITPAGILALIVLIALWPISTAGLQLIADDVAHGERPRFLARFRDATRLWGRMLLLGGLVYGSYTFWTVTSFGAMLGLAAQPTIVSLLLILLIGSFLIYIVARLFINFLFWEQVGALSGLGGLDALRESKRLARSRPNERPFNQPLYRGGIVASIWLLILLVFTTAAQLPFIFARFAGATDPDQAIAMAQQLAANPPNDALTIGANVLGAVLHAVLRPLLAASFLVLYYDALAGAPRRDV